ncbi:contact-dependent growth inhibition system immunity protein [Streptomyces sp. NPDC102467]|uniref:contact-dependent growth inhibition system immunity protein n=1 Tax=Streptomyces sp. NPDC102467 TaxID=3366179 RepID=UPI0037FC031C
MPMNPLEHDRRYGELDQVLRAYVGQPADDTEDRPGVALTAYLRLTWHTRPWALGTAESQLREYARNPPGALRLRLGEFYPVPDVGLPESDLQNWLFMLADHIKRSVEEGEVPPPSAPVTHWEWQTRFPELTQFLGGWFSQDMPDEFADHDAAVVDYVSQAARPLIARLAGEVQELLDLDLEESDLAAALAELGMEVDPPSPYAPSRWLQLVGGQLSGPVAEYRPPGS